ncbi:hypothetical protein NDU88_001774 [Pleurodeles waltl]|uniref:Uncharacterized protein n=1 Tax=Pleurodeles waltl TaxID=8319 RepID=A0AAV7Q809_PLEWA|nr:hypothetical protein NDU88_001774 [Pleurodeles waltl]
MRSGQPGGIDVRRNRGGRRRMKVRPGVGPPAVPDLEQRIQERRSAVQQALALSGAVRCSSTGSPGSVSSDGESSVVTWPDKKLKVTSRFLDLGLVVAKHLITRKWQVPEPPTYEAWAHSISFWASAEYTVLRHEDTLALRKYPLETQWKLMLADLSTPLARKSDRL